MQFIPYSYNGWGIASANSSGSFVSYFPPNSIQLQPSGNPVMIPRAYAPPKYATKDLQARQIEVHVSIMKGDITTQIDTLKIYLRISDLNLHAFIIQDVNTGFFWTAQATPVSMPSFNGVDVTFIMQLDDPMFQSSTVHSSTLNVLTSGDNINITNAGSEPAYPLFTITLTTAPSGTWLYSRSVFITNNLDTKIDSWAFDLTGGGWNTATLVSGSKCAPSGDDIRVFMGAVEQDRWLGSMNTALTTVWSVLTLAPRIEIPIYTAIAAGGTPAYIQFDVKNKTYKTLLKTLPPNQLALIDGECWVLGVPSAKTMRIPVVQRAAKGTTAAAHAKNAKLKWVQHDLSIIYGNLSADTPNISNVYQPLWNMNTSFNTSLVFDTYFRNTAAETSTQGKVTGDWTPGVLKGSTTNCATYSAPSYDTADPATAMGCAIQANPRNGKWEAVNGEVNWTFSHPCGLVSGSFVGRKYCSSAVSKWPTTAAAQVFKSGNSWANVWNEAAPTLASTWYGFSHNNAFSGSPTIARVALVGSQPATANAQALFEISDAIIGINGVNLPTITFQAEAAIYHTDVQLQNTTSGEYISIVYPTKANTPLIVDCVNHLITFEGKSIRSALDLSTSRNDWLNLYNGVNNIAWVWAPPVGNTGHVTLQTQWQDRSA